MNLTCTRCGDTFRITAEQLGTRGKCPHCKATVILPRAANRRLDTDEVPPADISMERWISLIGTVFLHLVALAILALIPCEFLSVVPATEGQVVSIGPADPLSVQAASEPRPKPGRVNVDSSRPMVDLFRFDRDSQSPATPPPAGSMARLLPGAGDEGEFAEDALRLFRGDNAQPNEFADMISRLQQDGLEIVITFDSTGSMEGEIQEVKRKIERLGSVLFRMIPETRISICTYRDEDAGYLVRGLPLTDDLGAVVRFLEDVDAAGGGDDPEAVEAGLEWSIEQNRFRDRARKVILLFGDSPPHAPDLDRCLRLASEFRRQQQGVVSTVTCHRDQRLPAFVEIARMGGGEAFLTREEHEIMTRLVVLVFGSKYRDQVIEAFNLSNR